MGVGAQHDTVDLVERPVRPCAEFSVVGARAGVPYELRGRACYAFDSDNPLGYMTMVSFSGAAPSAEESSQAREFIDNASPR